MSKTTIQWTDESWNPVTDAPGWFVSSTGRIRGLRGEMSQQTSKSGHKFVQVRVGGRRSKPRKLYIHREILKAFIGPCPDGHEARHLDGDPSHNVLSNLAWGTRLDQREDDRRNGVRRRGIHSLTAEKVRNIRAASGSLRSISERFGLSHTTIRKIRSRERYADV